MSPHAMLVAAAALTWTMLMVASLGRARGWTVPGMRVALGNRDALPEPSPFAARADRAAKNMVENLALVAALLLGAHWAAVPPERLADPCALFLAARVVYAPVYWAGVVGLRTAVWLVSVAAMAWIGALALALA
ncbi:MAG: MAPEG family protein [Nannocystaceae bacterium]|nr:MAPEG family protein [Nannocystaceae bacterium]